MAIIRFVRPAPGIDYFCDYPARSAYARAVDFPARPQPRSSKLQETAYKYKPLSLEIESPYWSTDANGDKTRCGTRLRQGGYAIRYGGNSPPGSVGVVLTVGSESHGFLIGKGYNQGSDDTMRQNLEDLLELIAMQDLWGKAVDCRVFPTTEDGLDILRGLGSEPQKLQAPVRPFEGELGLQALGEFDGDQNGEWDLSYTSKAWAPWLSAPLGGRRYFVYMTYDGGFFETEENRHGFDCTTYAFSAFGLLPSREVPLDTSVHVAEALGATKCYLEADMGVLVQPAKEGDAEAYVASPAADLLRAGRRIEMEAKPWNYLNAFFSDPLTGGTRTAGTYLVWTTGHIVVVEAGFVNQFNHRGNDQYSHPGYFHTPLAEWLSDHSGSDSSFTVRKVPGAGPGRRTSDLDDMG